MLLDKDEGKTTALSTSKINYIDPRISVAWCKKFGVPVDKILNRALREKFVWAMDLEEDWVIIYLFSLFLGVLGVLVEVDDISYIFYLE